MTRTAVVTGAAGGIGGRVVDRLVADGFEVHAVDRVQPRESPGVHARACDLTRPDEVDVLVRAVTRDQVPEVLVNVAGVLVPGEVLDLSADDWQRTFAVNLHATVALSQALGRLMADAGRGAVVTVASNSATTPRWGLSAYAASKAAVTMFTRCLGLELASSGVRCNVVAPGSTDTPMLHALSQTNGADESVRGVAEKYRVGIPLGRVATPDDIAEAVAFLVSPGARQITMHTLTVDGGATLGV